MRRLTRSEKKELTTTQLLETARAVFLERGYHRSTLDDIADAAGFTKGAVYARYATKDELFFALFDQWREQRTRETADKTFEHASFEDFMRGEARRMARLRHEHPQWYLLILEFWTYAVRDPRLREAFAARHEATAHAVVTLIDRAARSYGVKIRMPTLELARAGLAMFYGFTLERLADPAQVPEALLESMFAMLARAAVGAGTPAQRSSKAGNEKAKGNRRREIHGKARNAGSKVDG